MRVTIKRADGTMVEHQATFPHTHAGCAEAIWAATRLCSDADEIILTIKVRKALKQFIGKLEVEPIGNRLLHQRVDP